MKASDQYLKVVEWSDEDQSYVGSVPGWIGKCCHGDNKNAVYQELCDIVDEWVHIYLREGKPLPPATVALTALPPKSGQKRRCSLIATGGAC